MIHQAFHVLALVAFLAAMASAFLGAIRSFIGEKTEIRMPAQRTSVIVSVVAIAGLVADWVIHGS